MMPLVWRGLGFLVPLSCVPAYFLAMLIFKGADDKISNMSMHLITALLCLAIGWGVKKYRRSTCEEMILRNEKTQKEKTELVKRSINMKTGEEIITTIKDTFFGLPIMVWSIVFIVFSVIAYRAN